MVYRGPSELLNFCAFSERLDLFNLGGIFTFWQGALVPMDQFPDFAPGRGFTLALFWMIPTTCIPEGRMAPGVDDLCELLRPIAFAVALLSARIRAPRRKKLVKALMASFTGPHTALCCPDLTMRSWKRRLLPITHDASRPTCPRGILLAEAGCSFIICDRTVRSASGQQGGSAFVNTAQS